MPDSVDPLRVLRARWCLLAAAQPVLAAAGAPLPFRVTVSAGDRGVARYDASSTAGATLTWFGPDRAVLSCGDLGWRVAGAPGPEDRVTGAPSWLEHVSALDHRVSAQHYGWLAVWDGGVWAAEAAPEPGAPLPPVQGTAATAFALGARLERAGALFHLVRMCEYEWLDAAAWWAACGGLASERVIEESWTRLVDYGVTARTGGGPVFDGVPGRTPSEAKEVAAAHARERGLQIPDDVRVEAAMRTRVGWQVRFVDYRDADSARPLVISVPDSGAAWIEGAATAELRSPGTRPG